MNCKIIGITNKKGGIGKTTTALALSTNLSKLGYKVLTIDTDPQRNLSKVFNAKSENVATLYDILCANYKAEQCIQNTILGDIIAGDSNLTNADTLIAPSPRMYKFLKKSLSNIIDTYDYIIIDTPPHAGIILGNVLTSCDYVITPITCDLFGIQGLIDFYNIIEEYKEDNEKLSMLGILIIKYKERQNLTKDIEDNILSIYAQEMKTNIFNTKIRECVKCQEAQTLRKSIYDHAPNCTTAIDYDLLTKEILKLINK